MVKVSDLTIAICIFQQFLGIRGVDCSGFDGFRFHCKQSGPFLVIQFQLNGSAGNIRFGFFPSLELILFYQFVHLIGECSRILVRSQGHHD